MALFKVLKPDEYFLVRVENIYGSMLMEFPSYTNNHGIEFIYSVRLAMITRMARQWFFKEIQGKDTDVDDKGKPICKRCKTNIDKGDKYCRKCGCKINWTIKAIFKRTYKQTQDDPAWQEIAEMPTPPIDSVEMPSHEKKLTTMDGKEFLKKNGLEEVAEIGNKTKSKQGTKSVIKNTDKIQRKAPAKKKATTAKKGEKTVGRAKPRGKPSATDIIKA